MSRRDESVVCGCARLSAIDDGVAGCGYQAARYDCGRPKLSLVRVSQTHTPHRRAWRLRSANRRGKKLGFSKATNCMTFVSFCWCLSLQIPSHHARELAAAGLCWGDADRPTCQLGWLAGWNGQWRELRGLKQAKTLNNSLTSFSSVFIKGRKTGNCKQTKQRDKEKSTAPLQCGLFVTLNPFQLVCRCRFEAVYKGWPCVHLLLSASPIVDGTEQTRRACELLLV